MSRELRTLHQNTGAPTLIVLLPLWLARWLVRRDNSLDDATDE